MTTEFESSTRNAARRLRAALRRMHGPGWRVTPLYPGALVARRGRSWINYDLRFNGGSPDWFATGSYPWNLRTPDIRRRS